MRSIAAEIIALINAKPGSPTEDEIVAILAPHMNGTEEIAPAGLPPLADLEAAITACEAVDPEDTDASKHADGVLHEMENAIRAARPTSPAVLRAYAMIAKYWHRKNVDTEVTFGGKPWVKPSDCDGADEATAELIEAVLAYTGNSPLPAPATCRANYLASDWHRALNAYLDESSCAKTDDERDALTDRLCEVARAISAMPVRTRDDLIVRAAMAVHWYGDEISNPRSRDAEGHVRAAVVRGVLDLAGLKFDAEGRLAD